MSDYSLNITINGQDAASIPLQSVTRELHGVGEAADSASQQGGGFFSNMLSTAGGFLAANVIGTITSQFSGFITDGIADARDAAIVFGQTQAVIASTGGAAGLSAEQIADMAASLSAASGMSLFGDDEIQKGQNVLLTFTEIGKDVFPLATRASLDMAQALHKTPEAMTMMLGKALNSADGFAALKKSGVAFTDSQEEQIKTLFASGHAAEAQKIILGELNKEFGGSALAAAKADGGMAQFKDQLGELGEQLGGIALPLINQLVSVLISKVMPVAQGIASAIGTLAARFADAGADSVEFAMAIGALGAKLGLSEDAVTNIVFAIQDAIAAFQDGGGASGLFSTQIRDLGSIWAALQPVITNVVNAVSAVVMAVFGVVQTFLAAHGADISATLTDAWTRIMAIVKLGIELYNAIIPPVLKAIAGFINAHGKEIQAILSATWEAVKAVIDVALTLIQGVITAALQIIKGDWSGAWETIKTMCAKIVMDMITILKADLEILKTLFGGAIKWIQDEWEKLPAQLVAVGRAIVEGIQSGISSAWSSFTSWIHSKMMELPEAVRTALGIHSPSQVFADQVGAPIIDGIALGITNGASGLMDGLNGVLQNALAAAQSAVASFHSLSDIGIDLNADTVAGAFGGGSTKKSSGPKLPGFANGVANFKGGMALVGENGPEVVTLPRGSSVIPSGSGMGNTYITIAPGAIVITQLPGQNADQLAELVIRKVTDKLALRR